VAVEVGSRGTVHELIGRLQDAAAAHEQVSIDYYSFGRDAASIRDVDPWSVYSAGGQWYVAAWCHQADDERLFRVDRIRSVTPTGRTFDPPPARPAPDTFHPVDALPRVELDLDPADRWVLETYPTESVTEGADGRTRAVLAVGAAAWLDRLVLRLGPRSWVTGPPEARAAAAAAAARVRARYRR
jgi:proteasome accessory factor C